MNCIVTYFEPFGGNTINSSGRTAQLIPDEIAGCKITKLELPVDFEKCFPPLEKYIRELKPDIVLCLGEAATSTQISVEKIGINCLNTGQLLYRGKVRNNEAIEQGGPDGCFSSLPLAAIQRKIREKGLPVAVSYSAGTYVCNCLLYRLNCVSKAEFPQMLCGFIHLPYVSEQADEHPEAFTLPAERLAEGMEAAIEASVEAARQLKGDSV